MSQIYRRERVPNIRDQFVLADDNIARAERATDDNCARARRRAVLLLSCWRTVLSASKVRGSGYNGTYSSHMIATISPASLAARSPRSARRVVPADQYRARRGLDYRCAISASVAHPRFDPSRGGGVRRERSPENEISRRFPPSSLVERTLLEPKRRDRARSCLRNARPAVRLIIRESSRSSRWQRARSRVRGEVFEHAVSGVYERPNGAGNRRDASSPRELNGEGPGSPTWRQRVATRGTSQGNGGKGVYRAREESLRRTENDGGRTEFSPPPVHAPSA